MKQIWVALKRHWTFEDPQIKNVRRRCLQTSPIKEGWLPLPHLPRHASARGSYFKCHLQLYFCLKFQEIPFVFCESPETLTATNMVISFEFVTKLPSSFADWWIIPIAFDVSFRHKFHRGAEMYWRGPLFMSRRLLNAFSIDDVMALKSLYNKRPHGSPFDFTDVCTSETLDEHTGFFRKVKRSFVLSHEETQRNSVIKKIWLRDSHSTGGLVVPFRTQPVCTTTHPPLVAFAIQIHPFTPEPSGSNGSTSLVPLVTSSVLTVLNKGVGTSQTIPKWAWFSQTGHRKTKKKNMSGWRENLNVDLVPLHSSSSFKLIPGG